MRATNSVAEQEWVHRSYSARSVDDRLQMNRVHDNRSEVCREQPDSLAAPLDKPSAASGRDSDYPKRSLQSGQTFTGPTSVPLNSGRSVWGLRLLTRSHVPWESNSVNSFAEQSKGVNLPTGTRSPGCSKPETQSHRGTSTRLLGLLPYCRPYARNRRQGATSTDSAWFRGCSPSL